jgi:hypothetical protein
MKLTVFKKKPTRLAESVVIKLGSQHELDAADLKNKKIIDMIANEVHEKGFPDKFTLRVSVSTGQQLDLTFALYSKKINKQSGWHQLAFQYDIEHDSYLKIRALIKHAQQDPSDPDGEKADDLADELSIDAITVYADFEKEFTKVFGSTKVDNSDED